MTKEVNDCISRQAAIDAAREIIERDTSGNNDVVNAMIAWSVYIKGLPPVTPQSRWIPVSEKLPESFRFVNCTCHSLIDNRENWVIETIYVPQPVGSRYSDWGNIMMLNDGECEVIAWMYRDIPEPYKASPTGAESEDKK